LLNCLVQDRNNFTIQAAMMLPRSELELVVQLFGQVLQGYRSHSLRMPPFWL
jgi:hypothetical protein